MGSHVLPMDEVDRAIVNGLQGGFELCERPFESAARRLGLAERELLLRVQRLLDDGILSRFGPLYHAERLGGALSLCAMEVPEERFDTVAEQVNAFSEVAHNYQREHRLNMWFVLATESPRLLERAVTDIESATGLRVYAMPKLEEFFVGLRFEA